MFRRVFLAALAAAFGLLLASAPAWAHEEINPKSLATGKPTFFTLSAANEKKSNLVKVVLTAPKGVPLGATTAEPSGWEVSKTDTTLTWTAASGEGVRPDHFAQWGFETDGADQPGSFDYQIDLGYADGTHGPVTVPVTVSAARAPYPGDAAPPRPSQSRANTALAAAVAALVLGLAALAMALRRRPNPAPRNETGQDW